MLPVLDKLPILVKSFRDYKLLIIFKVLNKTG